MGRRSTESTGKGNRPTAVAIDWVAGIVIALVVTAVCAMLGGGLQPEFLLFVATFTAVIMLLVLRLGGWGEVVRRLREKPNDL